MLIASQVRALALSLPEATEQDHHGRPSFRVGGKIFATLWTPSALNIMLGEEGILAAVEDDPAVCSGIYWGRRLSAVQLDLRFADADMVRDLLGAAWRRKAPRRLIR
jgi:hypothetical protein